MHVWWSIVVLRNFESFWGVLFWIKVWIPAEHAWNWSGVTVELPTLVQLRYADLLGSCLEEFATALHWCDLRSDQNSWNLVYPRCKETTQLHIFQNVKDMNVTSQQGSLYFSQLDPTSVYNINHILLKWMVQGFWTQLIWTNGLFRMRLPRHQR